MQAVSYPFEQGYSSINCVWLIRGEVLEYLIVGPNISTCLTNSYSAQLRTKHEVYRISNEGLLVNQDDIPS